MNKGNETTKLFNEFLYQRYLMNRRQIREHLEKISLPEYIALRFIEDKGESDASEQGRTYFKYLSEKMQLSVQETSKMLELLSDRGMILWSHDGKGSEGTSVTLTESGRRILEEQETAFKDSYEKVIEKFGKENLYQLLHLMKTLETIVKSEKEEEP